MNDWLERDLRYNWHPFTQMSTVAELPPLLIERAAGLRLYDDQGRWYYDTISSWWCNVHGHRHPRLVEAFNRQLETLDHTLFAGITHRGAIELAERLVNLSPAGLDKVYYSDNGSTAVEIALKLSVQYWRNTGQPGKTGFVALSHAYHGDTVGGMSVSASGQFVEAFTPLMFKTHKVATPYCYRCPLGREPRTCATACAGLLEEALQKNAAHTAAIILEPLLLGAGGMIIYPAAYVARARELADAYGVHLILDEVATGFGRTGTMFACEQAGITPDFLCLSKGLTGGMLPLAATLTTQEVFDAFCGPAGSARTFYHGHTYTANPIGCAVALASLDIFAHESALEQVRVIQTRLQESIPVFRNHPLVGDIRSIGTVLALEMVKDTHTKEPFCSFEPAMRMIYSKGLDVGLILRPMGNVIYLFLPLCTTPAELDDIIGRMQVVFAAV